MSGMSGVGDNGKKNGDDKSLRDNKPSQASRNSDRAEKSLGDYKPSEKSLRDNKPFMHDRSLGHRRTNRKSLNA